MENGGAPGLNTLEPGSIIAGKYRVIGKLGEGGMGVVYEAVHQRLRHKVAIKMLLPSLSAQPDLVERFEREARAAVAIDSPNVAKVLDVDETLDGAPFMVIELLEGHDLGVELADRVQLPVEEAVGYVMTACAPIAQAHALGIVHRDLKPTNLFLHAKGADRVLKVLDFGIAKVFADKNAKTTSAGLGTPHYMSPEQVRRASHVDGRSDIWSLGVILYELLTGTVPFPDEPTAAIAAIVADPIVPPRELRKEIPEGLDRAIMRALEKDREKRFATARDFAEALAPFAGEEELVAVPRTEVLPRSSIPDIDTIPPPPPPPPPEVRATSRSGSMAVVQSSRPESKPGARRAVLVATIAGAAIALGALVIRALVAHPPERPNVQTVMPPVVSALAAPPETTHATVRPEPSRAIAPTSTLRAPKTVPVSSSHHHATQAAPSASASAASPAVSAPPPDTVPTSNPVTL